MRYNFFVILIFSTFFLSCNNKEQNNLPTEKLDENSAILLIKLKINKEIYLRSIYGESPQIVLWIEDTASITLQTLYVTYRAGNNDWKGKVNCNIVLPYWSAKVKGLAKENNNIKKEIDAISSATTKNDIIEIRKVFRKNSMWKLFIEVNVAGDYNKYFNTFTKEGIPDTEGNGQPSIVYSKRIEMKRNNTYKTLQLIGRTEQISVVDTLSRDLNKITTAKNIIEEFLIKVI